MPPAQHIHALALRRTATSVALLAALLAARPGAAEEFPYVRAGAPGGETCGAVVDGWERPDTDDGRWAQPSPADGGAPACEALRGRWRFDTGPELPRLAVLNLRIAHRDGLVVWLNGVEVARRRLPEGARWASETHGPGRETIPIRVAPGVLRERANLLAVEVRPSSERRAPMVELTLDGADGPRMVHGPVLQRLTGRSVVVWLQTDLPTEVEVTWGKRGAPEGKTLTSAAAVAHRLTLDGLAPGKAYRYLVKARAPQTGVTVEQQASFHTPPPEGRPLRVALYGDMRSGHDVHAQIVRDLCAEDPDVVVTTGDIVARGSDEADWQRYFEVAGPLLRQVAVYHAPGNHDYGAGGQGLARFLAYTDPPTGKPWFGLDVSGVHFAFLDSGAYRDPEQLAWLEQDLAEARKRKPRAIFALVHHGPYSSGGHGDSKIATRDYVPVLLRHRVTAIFEGHDHQYERGKVGALVYVVSGGGGAELRRLTCGVPGKRRCAPRSLAIASEHHYVMLEVRRRDMVLCPKRPDGTLLEACVKLPLR